MATTNINGTYLMAMAYGKVIHLVRSKNAVVTLVCDPNRYAGTPEHASITKVTCAACVKRHNANIPAWSNMHTGVKVGDLVYVDAFRSSWLPGRVEGYTSGGEVQVKLTAARPGYRRGEVISQRSNNVVPRKHVYTRNGQYRIRGSWEFDRLATEHQPVWAEAK